MQLTVRKTAYHSVLLIIGLLAPLMAGPTFKSFRIPTDNSQPIDIVLGSDGNMWFTESEINVSQIGRIDAQGNITEFVVPTQFSQPSDIVAGADGALWFSEPSGFPFGIGRITTDGVFTEYGLDLNTCNPCSITPNGIAAAPDESIWFTDFNRNAIGKLAIDPVTGEGIFTFYDIPTLNAVPAGITLGPDGALWFAEFGGGQQAGNGHDSNRRDCRAGVPQHENRLLLPGV